MAATIPARFLLKQGADLTRIALGRTIDKSGEVGDWIERTNYLYSVSNRRAIFGRVWLPLLTTTSASPIALPDYTARVSKTRTTLAVVSYAQDAVVTVGIYNAASGALLGSAVTLTHPAGSYTQQAPATYTGVTVQDVLVRVSVNRNASTASLSSVRILELAVAAADLPT